MLFCATKKVCCLIDQFFFLCEISYQFVVKKNLHSSFLYYASHGEVSAAAADVVLSPVSGVVPGLPGTKMFIRIIWLSAVSNWPNPQSEKQTNFL